MQELYEAIEGNLHIYMCICLSVYICTGHIADVLDQGLYRVNSKGI